MTENSDRSVEDPNTANSHHALIDLHARAGTFGDLDPEVLPGFNRSTTAEALRSVAEAPESEIPTSARLAVLHDLAKADWPELESAGAEYRLLAASIAETNNLDAATLLDDLKRSAQEEMPFNATANGSQLPHHMTAFIGEDICHIGRVDIDGLNGTWIFSEFETDAPFDNVVGWVDPHSWPKRGPMLFKQMSLVGGHAPVGIGELGSEHWHGVFHEEVQLVSRVNTLLHCDYWRDGGDAAGMTYELNLSLDGEINVDRGFLLVNDVGPVRRVKALKIVGFSQPVWDQVASTICPFWTDWVRSAVEGGSSSTPQPPSETPDGGTSTPGDAPLGDLLEAWIEFFGDSARAYLDLFGDTVTRATTGGYSAAEWVDDGSKVWSQLAKDWAKAWSFGMELVDEVREQGLDAGFMPPGKPKDTARGAMNLAAAASPAGAGLESTLIPVAGLTEGEQPSCSDLISIEAGGRRIRSGDIRLSVETLADGTPAVRVSPSGTGVVPGLYVGELTGSSGVKLARAQLYISGARQTDRS